MRGDHGFQSTLPARGATSYRTKVMLGRKFQSTLPARGATRRFPSLRTRRGISIHAPRTGSDLALRVLQILHELFQSTLPARGATKEKNQFAATYSISIHAPRTGSDVAQQFSIYFKNHFNPRSPHGERPAAAIQMKRRNLYFNPRSPHGERLRPSVRRIPACHFNPRSPHGERLKPYSANAKRIQFQSTLPARGATPLSWQSSFDINISIHAPRTGSDLGNHAHRVAQIDFNPRSPHGERRPEAHPPG